MTDKIPTSPAGRDLRDDVIDAMLNGFPDTKIPAPAWSRCDKDGHVALIDMVESNLATEDVCALLRILALAAGSSDKVVSLSAHAFIAKMAAYHAWTHEDDLWRLNEPEDEHGSERMEIDSVSRALFQRIGMLK